ncbi:MAG: NFACT RNA binding domain-containing protein [Deltaproteobacteria bacterium]
MTLSAAELRQITEELLPLVGGRIQRVDLVAEREAVLEVRVPGRTVRLLVSARPGLGRVHVVESRPTRQIPGGNVQALLRRRLGGQLLAGLSCVARTFTIDTPAARFSVRIDGGKDAFLIQPPVELASPEDLDVPEAFPASKAVADRYGDRADEVVRATKRQQLLSVVARKRKKLARLAKNVERDVDRLQTMVDGARFGELLKTSLHTVKRGATSVTVTDWSTSEPVDVPLDPKLSAKANLERYFTRAKKGSRGLPIAEARAEKIRSRIAELDATRDRIDAASDEELDRIAAHDADALAGVTANRIERDAKPKAAKVNPAEKWARRFEAVDGSEIWVGRGAKENDRLSFNVAKADDVWLHARGTAGAHVILRNDKGQSPSSEALLDAAHLAAFYSSAKNDAKVEVLHTEARHVKKTKGAPPGLVGVAKSKTLLVRMDSARLDRLLGRDAL